MENKEELIEYKISINDWLDSDVEDPEKAYKEDKSEILQAGYRSYGLRLIENEPEYFIFLGTRESVEEYLDYLGFVFHEYNVNIVDYPLSILN